MELSTIKAGPYELQYNPTTTDVYVDEVGEEWEIEIYQHKHYQGSLEIDSEGHIVITEDFGLKIERAAGYKLLVK